jgi:hypothetical protein
MYLCWSVRGRVLRAIGETVGETSLFVGNKSDICSPTDREIVMFDGEKFPEKPAEVGADSEQFTAQQSRAASAAGDFSLLRALSQHAII